MTGLHPEVQPRTAAADTSDAAGTEPQTAARYEQVVADLAYTYDGIFSADAIREAVDESRRLLEANATIRTYLPVLTARFAKQRLTAAAQARGRLATPVPELLFICVHNSGRSQMAAALAEHLSGGRVHVRSAGSAPTDQVNPLAIQALAERGIDLTQAYPKPLTDEVTHAADVIITMGCGDACPIYPGKRYLDWDVTDPDGQPLDIVRDIRDDLTHRVTTLLRELGI